MPLFTNVPVANSAAPPVRRIVSLFTTSPVTVKAPPVMVARPSLLKSPVILAMPLAVKVAPAATFRASVARLPPASSSPRR